MPPSVEERLAYLEGKVQDHSAGFGEVRELLTHMNGDIRRLDRKVDGFRQELAGRMDGLASRIDAVDQKVDGFRQELAARIDGVDRKVDGFRQELASRIDGLAGRMDAMIENQSRHFKWLMAVHVGFFLTVIGFLIRS